MADTSRKVVVRLTGRQHAKLKAHLFPGDGKEAVAIALCGRRDGGARHCLMVNEIELIPHDECPVRTPELLTWSTQRMVPMLQRAARMSMAILKIHSHPNGLACFSPQDSRADAELFSSIYGWFDERMPHGSAIMLPNGRLFGRAVSAELDPIPFAAFAVAGSNLDFFYAEEPGGRAADDYLKANAQAFGRGTTERLGKLCIGVVGCSGTGTPVIEMLTRLGVGRLIIVDPDIVQDRNV